MATFAKRTHFPVVDLYGCVSKPRITKKSLCNVLYDKYCVGNLFSKPLVFFTLLTLLLLPNSQIFASVSDITATDVTTRALSVVWVSDEPVASATIRIYSDINGVVDLTPSLNIVVDSDLVANAHAQGIVKVTASGLSADTDYYVQTETVGSTGVDTLPAFSSLLLVHTALETAKANSSNSPIVNDVLLHDVFFPDGTTPAPGALVIANVEGISAYPVTAFTGENGFVPQTAAIDTNNFFGTDGRSLELQTDDALRISVFRGLLCSTDFLKQGFFEFRRNPGHEESPPITELETTANCYMTDTICDNDVNILDVQFVINSIDTTPGDCGFNPTVDVFVDGDINILDVQSVINEIDTTVPNRP